MTKRLEYCLENIADLNKSVSSTSVDGVTNSMYFTKPPVEYGTTTHDLELAFSQTPENRGKITEYTAAFPSEINASHYVPVESDIIRLPVELGNEKISYNKDIVLLLGDTGVGKSTLLYYITGAELDVKNANISGERTSILKSNGHFSRSKISHDTPRRNFLIFMNTKALSIWIAQGLEILTDMRKISYLNSPRMQKLFYCYLKRIYLTKEKNSLLY
ncbi:hypothetical protein [Candidatus Lariskella endosymbiont of Hedychridium roseum]|uniref:hypothetical protein n=1 Tax=Candidatus Lariskella endosymbiont of Hedychridium roseum TaxID=3077949 RepID=UPI0030D5C647